MVKIFDRRGEFIMIKHVIFDIGNVILDFDYKKVINQFTSIEEEKEFIMNNIIYSPEWLGFGLIDTGYITKEEAVEIVKDRTNHENDDLIENFWNNYNDYAIVDNNVLNLIRELKEKGYNIYLLSNMNEYTYDFVKRSGLFDIVDGYVLSYQEHQIKPYISIYNTLLNRYKLIPNECIFIDDNEKNIETAINLGMAGKIVKPDNYDSVIEVVNGLIK